MDMDKINYICEINFKLRNMLRTFLLILFLNPLFYLLFSQDAVTAEGGYKIELITDIESTSIKDQQNTNTCWSFSCSSFLEAEMIRMGKDPVDLSEMYTVYYTYLDKAERYMRLKGKASFSEGGLGHDVISVLDQYGAVPEDAFSGKNEGENHDHEEMVKELNKLLKKLLKQQKKGDLSPDWREEVMMVLDKHLGLLPYKFYHDNEEYTSTRFAEEVVGLNPNDYVSFTSFSHRPMYKPFVLEVPDNYSQGRFYNVHINELKGIALYALQQNFTIVVDGDVSDKAFRLGEASPSSRMSPGSICLTKI